MRENRKQEYNNFIAAQESGSFLQGWEWGEWQAALGREVLRYFIGKDNNNNYNDNILASIQMIKMPLPFGKHYLYCPYGPVTDLRFKIEDLRFLIQELKKNFHEAVFIRIEPKINISLILYPLSLTKTKNIQPGKTLLIDLSKSEEKLLAEMHPKTRYNIKVAQKHGVEIKDEFDISIRHGLYAKEAVELIVETAKRQGYKGYGLGYYEKMIDYLAMREPQGDLKLHIYKAIFQNQLLASSIIIDFGKTRTFLFGGSSLFHKNVMAPFLMHFKAMLDAKAQGLSFYDFWGIETAKGDTPGFVRFKLGFSESIDAIKQYDGAFDMVNNQFLYAIYKVFRYIHRLV